MSMRSRFPGLHVRPRHNHRAPSGYAMCFDGVRISSRYHFLDIPIKKKSVVLTSGHRVEDVESESGLKQLLQAVFSEADHKIRESEDFTSTRLYEMCICELFFVAAQLLQMKSSFRLGSLLDKFDQFWERVAEAVNAPIGRWTM